jgi:hypothetical protein
MLRIQCSLLAVLLVLLPYFVWAEDAQEVSGYEDAFDLLRNTAQPGYRGDTVEDAIARFFERGKVDEGTYPPSEMWERGMDLRRTKPPQVGISGRVFFKYSDNDISQIEKWEHEYEFNLKYLDWDAYFRFSDVNPDPHMADPFRWEKGRVRYRGDGYKVTAGSLSQLFGRGLALNMYEDRILDFDNEIEGAKVEAEIGNADATVLWGGRKDRSDLHHSTVGAARVEFPVADGVDMGVHAVRVEFPSDYFTVETPDLFDYELLGADVDIRAGDFNLYAETVELKRNAHELAQSPWDSSGDNGEGYYANAGFSGKGFYFNTEYKNYEGLAHPFSVMPPVRRWSEAASADPNYDEGYGISLNWNPFRNGSLFDISYVQDRQGASPVPYTEAAVIYSSPPTKDTTWVAECWYVYDFGQKHDIGCLTLNHELSDDWTATTFLERENIDPGFMDPHNDYIIEGELAYQSKLNLIYTYETTGEQDVPVDSWEVWEIKLRPDELQEFNLVFGSRREGLVCSGGVCRIEPAFDGLRVDYLRRF